MDLLSQLSSQRGDRTETSNRRVLQLCLADPALLESIAAGLESSDPALLGDCVEILTEVGHAHPEWVAPYAARLPRLLDHPSTRVRWEVTHALAHIAALRPDVIEPMLPRLAQLIAHDPSVIARDHAVDILSELAAAGPAAARQAYPFLVDALEVWEGKHAGHALPGLARVAAACPELRADVKIKLENLLRHPRGVVRKAAAAALKRFG
jgi:HEAT repeat protein